MSSKPEKMSSKAEKRKLEMDKLFHQAEQMHNAMADKLQELMVAEVKEHSFEMAMEIQRGKPAFSHVTTTFIEKVAEMGRIMAFLDDFRCDNVKPGIKVREWSEAEEFAHRARLGESGMKIRSIKALRTAVVGLGLKEAKDAVEHFMEHSDWSNSFLREHRGY